MRGNDGHVILALQESTGVHLTRLSSNGSPDTTFGVNGVVVIHELGASQQVVCARIQKDGRIVAISTETFTDGTDAAVTCYWN